MNRIGCHVVPREQFLRPIAWIVVKANEAARPGLHAPVMEQREIVETKLLRDLAQEELKILRVGATARLLFEQVGKARLASSSPPVRYGGTQ